MENEIIWDPEPTESRPGTLKLSGNFDDKRIMIAWLDPAWDFRRGRSTDYDVYVDAEWIGTAKSLEGAKEKAQMHICAL